MEPRPTGYEKSIQTLDLNFLGIPGAIAAYLIPHTQGAILVECGPGSTVPALIHKLETYGFSPGQVTDVFLTHIHLDHAGAAGWLACQGAQIHVHPVGAPHLLHPEKLLASASRIYGERMESLWGEFLPVPKERLSAIQDGEVVEVNGLRLRALDTPGHANHHYAYFFDEVCFSGDIGGVRIAGMRHLRLPMPPPELHLEKWRQSLVRLGQERITYIAPTHFGVFDDPGWHLVAVAKALDEAETWMEAIMPGNPPFETLNQKFLDWTRDRSFADGLDPTVIDVYETANPSWMSSHGIQRYWEKFRVGLR